MDKLIKEICERITRLEEKMDHVIENGLPHLADEMKFLKRWIYGLFGSIILFILYAVLKDVL